MSKVVQPFVSFQFVSVVLIQCARREYISDYCGQDLGASEQDALEVLQHHLKQHGEDGDTYLMSLLALEFIRGRRKSIKDEPSTLLSPPTTVVTIK